MTKKQMMTSAHRIAKGIVRFVGDYQIALSIALKEVWRQVKTYNKKRFGDTAIMNAVERLTTTKQDKEETKFWKGTEIPVWIMSKNLSNDDSFKVTTATSDDVSVVRETERAKLFSFSTDYGIVEMWAPKSVLRVA